MCAVKCQYFGHMETKNVFAIDFASFIVICYPIKLLDVCNAAVGYINAKHFHQQPLTKYSVLVLEYYNFRKVE